MHRAPFSPLPTDTARAAKSVFNIENLYLAIGDQLDVLFSDLNLDALYAFSGKPAGTTFNMAMVTIFQFAEDLPDRQAADAVRTRMDWKYALHLPSDCSACDPSELREFRQRLLLDKAGQDVFQIMLNRLTKLGLLGGRGKRCRDVTSVLTAVDALSRVDKVTEAMTLALEVLASRQPDWLLAISLPHWYERYDQNFTLRHLPDAKEEQEVLAQAIGADISHLLEVTAATGAPAVAPLPELQALRRLWHQEFEVGNNRETSDAENGH